MSIVINLDVVIAKRKMKLITLAEKVGISVQNLSVLNAGRARAVRFSTLEAICRVLNCQPGDILEYVDDDNVETNEDSDNTMNFKTK